MIPNEEDMIWSTAQSARKLAFRAALRNKALWGDQLVIVLCGMIKAFCVSVAVSTAFQRTGLPESICHVFAALVTLPLMAFNPRAFFWRNVFTKHADAAFAKAVRDYVRS
jgi:hypothetical protein